MRTLPLEQKVGQLLMARIEGTYASADQPELVRALEQVARLGVGGFAVGIGTPTDLAAKLNVLQKRSSLPLWFGADLEWGAGMRLWRPTFLPYGIEGDGGTAFPFNMGVAATRDPALAERAGLITGREARAVGIHWVFAPVADVNTSADNPIVNVRSYGSDAAEVSRFVAAFVRGARAGGVLTTAKHFPGHGDTHEDSHISLPVLEATRNRLDSIELAPFRAAVAERVSSVMIAHLAVPAVTGDRTTASSLSAALVTGVLRQELGFDGLIVTDALTMGALRKQPGYSPGELAVRAVEAGADVVLSPPDVALAHAALLNAVKSGRLSVARIDASVRRILAAKAAVGLHRRRLVDLDELPRVVASGPHEAFAAEVAQRSITLARDSAGLIPLDPRKVRALTVIAFSAPNDAGAGRQLAASLRAIYSDVRFVRVDERTSAQVIDDALRLAESSDAILFSTFLMPISGQGEISVPVAATALAERVMRLGKPALTIAFGDPYGPAGLPTASTYLLAWQPRGEHSQVAAARAIAGLAPIAGVVPVALEGIPRGTGLARDPRAYTLQTASAADAGMDERALMRVDSIIGAGIAAGASPGVALAVGRYGKLVRLRGYGRLDQRPGFADVTDSSLYDLASLTKVVSTTTASMMLIDAGLLDLDAPVKQFLPEWTGTPAKEAVTIRNLLLHNSGLTAGGALWRTVHNREEALAAIAPITLDYEPGTRTVYSDYGIILLGLIVERLTGRPIDQFVGQRIFAPLGLHETAFNPLERDTRSLLPRIAPTEIDTLYRKRHLQGLVHDENAYAIGGVSGHAGLFSSARDLAAFSQMLLDGGFYNGVRLVRAATVEQYTHRQSEASSRALGWDTPAPNSSAGAYFSASAFGHTGYTGTSIWIDPEQQLFVVLLTNRVNPTRENQKHVALRIAVADAVQAAIVDTPAKLRAPAPAR